jgi:hypothetical protein
MTVLFILLAVTGGLCWLLAGTTVLVIWIQVISDRRSRPQVGDDAIAMVRQSWADDKVRADLEAELAEMDKRIRGETGG